MMTTSFTMYFIMAALNWYAESSSVLIILDIPHIVVAINVVLATSMTHINL